jgi:pimeloyl-ACP methyl ester carboxylesterase
MRRLLTSEGRLVSYERQGEGPPLVLVHGGFSDHHTNWEFVQPLWARDFTTFAIARPGRGETPPAPLRSLEDDARDTVALLEAIGEPASLLGHSYGAHVALVAAASAPARVRRLVLYEPPWTSLLAPAAIAPLEALAAAGDWDSFSYSFFHDVLQVPGAELDDLRSSPLWAPIVADAPASLADLRALSRYRFRPDAFIDLPMPVLLQTGTESPQHFYATDALLAALPAARVARLKGQAHEGMTTAPAQYADQVRAFLKEKRAPLPAAAEPARSLAF